MINNIDIIADLHTHTIASFHAYSTLKENIDEAHSKGIRYLAITDHYTELRNDDNSSNIRIMNNHMSARINYMNLQQPRNGVKLIQGSEFNIGEIPDPKFIKNLTWRPIGLHSWYFDKNMTPDDILNTYEKCLNIEEFKPNAFCHIEREVHNLKDITEYGTKKYWYSLIDLAEKYGIYIELNESSLRDYDKSYNHLARMRKWFEYAQTKDVMFYLGSDAHFCEKVGDFENVICVLNHFNIKPERILNHSCNENLLKTLVI